MKEYFKNLLTKSLSRYLAIGVIAFAIDYVTLLFCYYGLSLALNISTSLGFIAGFVISFYFNRNWVFGNSGKHRRQSRQLIEYSILVVINYTFTVLGVSFLNETGVQPYIGKVAILLMITVWNFLIFKYIIFTNPKD